MTTLNIVFDHAPLCFNRAGRAFTTTPRSMAIVVGSDSILEGFFPLAILHNWVLEDAELTATNLKLLLVCEVFSLLCAGNLCNTCHSQFARVEQQDLQVPGTLQGCMKEPTSSSCWKEKVAASNFEPPVTAPLEVVSKIAPGFWPARPGPGID
jgi:hypothetical protein